MKSLLRFAAPFILSLAVAAPAWAANAPPPQAKDTAAPGAAPAAVQTKHGFYCNMLGAAPAAYWKSKQHAKVRVPKTDKAQQPQPAPQP